MCVYVCVCMYVFAYLRVFKCLFVHICVRVSVRLCLGFSNCRRGWVAVVRGMAGARLGGGPHAFAVRLVRQGGRSSENVGQLEGNFQDCSGIVRGGVCVCVCVCVCVRERERERETVRACVSHSHLMSHYVAGAMRVSGGRGEWGQQTHGLPLGDFPSTERFKELISKFKIWEFSSLSLFRFLIFPDALVQLSKPSSEHTGSADRPRQRICSHRAWPTHSDAHHGKYVS
jgi:hypothetical protein